MITMHTAKKRETAMKRVRGIDGIPFIPRLPLIAVPRISLHPHPATTMSFATRHRDDPMPDFAPLSGLVFRREHDARVMAALQGRDVAHMRARFADGNRAYVATLDGEPAAWGWIATLTATIGELAATFAIPAGHRYLWNFVTRPEHRGRGIYPRLLEHILREEARESERFWIAYAPENRASAKGIARSGFTAVAELSFDGAGQPAVRGTDLALGGTAASVLGLPRVEAPLAPCWKCIRAGRSADRACRDGRCCCDYQEPTIPCATSGIST
jgi:GNAT superfamily N-acetyltransferase